MDRERYARMHAIFEEARKLQPGEASKYLAAACAEDTTLRDEVEALLEFSAAEGDAFSDQAIMAARNGLERVAANLTGTGVIGEESFDHTGAGPANGDPAAPLHPARMIGPYRIIKRIGSGGMGTVYEAVQERPERRVAVKTIRRRNVSEITLARFRQEAEILGRLQHPGIAQIFEFGIDPNHATPVPYFAMEFVRGRSLTKHASAEALDIRERLALMARVCDAVAHAHEKGVVHRDLKPDNILVDATGQPKVLDFGVARTAELIGTPRLTMTGEGQLIGTLGYMAPEQARGSTNEITAATDVYALGAIGFELLIGRPPHDLAGLSLSSALLVLTHEPAPRIGMHDDDLRGDVETIIGKALEMEPGRRYANAAELAADIRRYMDDRPIVARPAGRIYRARKFIRRHRALVGGAMATFATLCVGVSVAITLGLEERQQRRLAQDRETQARLSTVKAASGLVNAALAACDPARPWGSVRQLLSVPREMVGWETRYVARRLPWVMYGSTAGDAVFERDGRVASTCDTSGNGTTWDVDDPWSGQVLTPGAAGGHASTTGAAVGVILGEKQAGVIDRNTRAIRWSIELPFRGYYAHCSADGSTLGVRTADGAEIVCHRNGTEVFRRSGGAYVEPVISDDGRFICIVNLAAGAELIDASSGKVLHSQLHTVGSTSSISPDGKFYYVASDGGPLVAIDTQTLETRWRTETALVSSPIHFSPDGTLMSLTGYDGITRILESATGVLVRSITGQGACRVAFSRDNATVGMLPFNGPFTTMRVRSDSFASQDTTLIAFERGQIGNLRPFEFSPDGRQVLLQAPIGDLPWIIDFAHPWQDEPMYLELKGHTEWVYQLAVSHDGTMIASAAPLDPIVRVWNAFTGEQIAGLERTCDTRAFEAFLTFSWDDSTLVMTSHRPGVPYSERGTGVIVWDLATGKPTFDWSVTDAYPYDEVFIDRVAAHLGDARGARLSARTQISPSGDTVARGGWTSGPQPAEIKSLPDLQTVTTLAPEISGIAFHPSGRFVACGGNGRFHIIDLSRPAAERTNGAERTFSLAGRQTVYCLAYSPDGSRLAAGCTDGSVTIFETEFYQPMLDLPPHKSETYSYVYALDWTPDGTRLVTASGDTTIRIWDSLAPAARRRHIEAINNARPRMDARLTTLNAQLNDAARAAAALRNDPGLQNEERAAAALVIVERWAGSRSSPRPAQ